MAVEAEGVVLDRTSSVGNERIPSVALLSLWDWRLKVEKRRKGYTPAVPHQTTRPEAVRIEFP